MARRSFLGHVFANRAYWARPQASCVKAAAADQRRHHRPTRSSSPPAPATNQASCYPLTILVVLVAISALIRSAAAHNLPRNPPHRPLANHLPARPSPAPRPRRCRNCNARSLPAASRDCWTTFPAHCGIKRPSLMPSAAGAHVQEKKTSPARTPSYLRPAASSDDTAAGIRARHVRTVAPSSFLLPGDGRWFQPVPYRRPVSLPKPTRQEPAFAPQRLAHQQHQRLVPTKH